MFPTEKDTPQNHPYSDFHRERIRAHLKHDDAGGSMERKTWYDPAWLAVVTEELGEAAHTLTYDFPLQTRRIELTTELIQVGAMVAAWLDAISDDER